MGWAACQVLGALALGVVGTSHGFISPAGWRPGAHPSSRVLDPAVERQKEALGLERAWTTARRTRQAGVTVLSARRGRGRGTWSGRRRRGDQPNVEFDKAGYPLPPRKTPKEEEAEHKKWFESMEPEDGYEEFDPAAEGLTAEDMEDPFLEAAVPEPVEGGVDDDPPMRDVDYENIPEWAGEMLGMDDPLDAPWRLKTEEVVRQAVSEAGFETYDITWHLHRLNIDIANTDEEAGSPTSDQITEVLQQVEEALFPHDEELRVLERFNIIIGTRGARDVLTTEREFNAFKGFEVMVSLRSPVNETDVQPVRIGRLVSRTPQFTTINVNGRNVKIPTDFIKEVRLPPAKREEDDFEVMLEDDEWGELFVSGKVPKTLEVEMVLPGLVSWDSGVELIEGDYYEPPDEDEDEEGDDLDGLDDDDDLAGADFDLDDLDDVVVGDDD